MSPYEITALIFSGLALIISVLSMFFSGRANVINIKTFKRQGIIDLHMAWQGVADIDATNLITPDVVKAANAINLTASLWNHDVIEKIVLYQTY